MSTRITLTINGETVETQADVTLGSVLHQRQGSWRSSPLRHAPRGIYCGMGVCFECAVSRRRRCRPRVHNAGACGDAGGGSVAVNAQRLSCDVLVIGAGPAGLAAAAAAREYGADVICLDLFSRAGGQYHMQPAAEGGRFERSTQVAGGRAAEKRCRDLGVRFLLETEVFWAELRLHRLRPAWRRMP